MSRAAALPLRSVLPRAVDAVLYMLELMSEMEDEEDIWMFVIDFIDAFFLIPLSRKERRFFVAFFRKKYYIFRSNSQGSR